jgi:hypothetical protein
MMNPIPLILDDSFHFQKRFWWSPTTWILDAADYPRGYLFKIPGFALLKLKISKLMEAPKYVTVVKIFRWEFERA